MSEFMDMVYLGPEPWDGPWRNRHQLMALFARESRVVYVDPLPRLADLRRSIYQRSQVAQRDFAYRASLDRIQDGLYVYRSSGLTPLSGRPLIGRISLSLWARSLRSVLRQLGIGEFVLWYSRPSMCALWGVLKEAKSVYHVVDDYLAYGGVTENNRGRIEVQDRWLASHADLVITVSKPLFERYQSFNERTHLVRNAANVELYSHISIEESEVPPDLRDLPRPIIGYSGLISPRLDFDVLEAIAAAYPDASLVLLGKVDEAGLAQELARLSSAPNIHLLGLKDVKDVPAYVAQFDVALIPYRMTQEVRSLSSLKLYDYFALGKPVVTTRFPEAEQFEGLVSFCATREEFVAAVGTELERDDRKNAAARRRVAAENTWQHRVSEIRQALAVSHCYE